MSTKLLSSWIKDLDSQRPMKSLMKLTKHPKIQYMMTQLSNRMSKSYLKNSNLVKSMKKWKKSQIKTEKKQELSVGEVQRNNYLVKKHQEVEAVLLHQLKTLKIPILHVMLDRVKSQDRKRTVPLIRLMVKQLRSQFTITFHKPMECLYKI